MSEEGRVLNATPSTRPPSIPGEFVSGSMKEEVGSCQGASGGSGSGSVAPPAAPQGSVRAEVQSGAAWGVGSGARWHAVHAWGTCCGAGYQSQQVLHYYDLLVNYTLYGN